MHRSSRILPILFLVGCAHKPDVKTEEPPAPAPVPAPASEATESSARACTEDTDCKASEVCSERACVAVSAASLGDCTLVRVHFSFDSTEIAAGDRTGLERSAQCLRAHQHLTVMIEGNADERGTDEYNLALGASDAQLKTISYGKERPLCTQHDEACWAQNRRAAVRPPAATNEQ